MARFDTGAEAPPPRSSASPRVVRAVGAGGGAAAAPPRAVGVGWAPGGTRHVICARRKPRVRGACVGPAVLLCDAAAAAATVVAVLSSRGRGRGRGRSRSRRRRSRRARGGRRPLLRWPSHVAWPPPPPPRPRDLARSRREVPPRVESRGRYDGAATLGPLSWVVASSARRPASQPSCRRLASPRLVFTSPPPLPRPALLSALPLSLSLLSPSPSPSPSQTIVSPVFCAPVRPSGTRALRLCLAVPMHTQRPPTNARLFLSHRTPPYLSPVVAIDPTPSPSINRHTLNPSIPPMPIVLFPKKFPPCFFFFSFSESFPCSASFLFPDPSAESFDGLPVSSRVASLPLFFSGGRRRLGLRFADSFVSLSPAFSCCCPLLQPRVASRPGCRLLSTNRRPKSYTRNVASGLSLSLSSSASAPLCRGRSFFDLLVYQDLNFRPLFL